MRTVISNKIYIYNATKEVYFWCRDNLVVQNPLYNTLMRLGKQDQIRIKHIPENMNLYVEKNISLSSQGFGDLILPYGCIYAIWPMIKKYPVETKFNEVGFISVAHDTPTCPLFDYQEEAVENMMKAGSGILIGGTGSGKTNCGIEICRRTGKKFLWLTHTKDLVKQSYERFKSLYPNIQIGTVGDGKLEFGQDGTIATIQTMVTLDPDLYKDDFDLVITDECFPAGTLISTKEGYKKVEDIKIGDSVLSFNHKEHKTEYKKVKRLFVKTSSMLHTIKIDDKIITATKNHPIFTQRGYIQMEDLTYGDYVLCNMSKSDYQKRCDKFQMATRQKKGKNILQQGMLLERAKKTCLDRRNEKKDVRENDKSKLFSSSFSIEAQTNEREKSYVGLKCSTKNVGNQKEEWNVEFTNKESWWEWPYCSLSTKAERHFIRNGIEYNNGVSSFDKQNDRTKACLSNVLQNRYCNSEIDDSNRNRWEQSLWRESQNARCKEESILVWIRVESFQSEKQSNNRKCTRSCTVYNFEVEDNNNYFANDILVHNCHHVSGSPELQKMFVKVVEKIAAKHKYGLTASKNRNDSLGKTMYTTIGANRQGEFAPVWEIKKSDTKTLTADHIKVELDTPFSYEMLNTDGTFNYVGLVDYLANCEERNKAILDKIEEVASDPERKQLVLCTRKAQCELLHEALLARGIASELLIGKVSSKKREAILKEKVDWQVVVATVSLAKEGLDLPNLNTLHLASCIGNESDTIQSVGRIERFKENKPQPWVFDYVDVNIPYLVSRYKKRVNWLRKRG